jgi:hypothetical protein
MLPNLREFVKFLLRFQIPTLSLLTSILSKLIQTSNLLSFFLPSTKTNHSSPTKKGYGNKYFQDSNRKWFLKKRTPNDLNSPFKKKENEGGEGRSQLGGQWKVPMFDGPWKATVLGGQWKEKEKHLFTSSHFPPKKFYLNLHFFLWS